MHFNTRMCGMPASGQRVTGITLAGAHNIAVGACRLQNKSTVTASTRLSHDVFAMPDIDLFIRDLKKPDFPKRAIPLRKQRFHCIHTRL
jgi:hypothetical protein